MKNTGSLVAVIVVSILLAVVVMVGSIRKRPVIAETQAVAENYATFDSGDTERSWEGDEFFPEVNTVLADQGRLIIGASDGLYALPFSDRAPGPRMFPLPEKCEPGVELMHLNAILPLGDQRYVGGDGLYQLDDNYTRALGVYYLGETVNTIMEFGEGILVGTDRGLWFHCDTPTSELGCIDTLLKDDVIVTALATDRTGLWVGTYGDGLFYCDGREWQERYLTRDTLVFSFINALDYYYPFLWLGTDKAIFRYDGGKWAQMFVEDSSEDYTVSCILTTPAATYIGTEDGLLRYASETLEAVDGYQGMAIAGLCVSEEGVIVATRQDGIYTFKGKEEIVSPEQLTSQNAAGNTEDEVLSRDGSAWTDRTDR